MTGKAQAQQQEDKLEPEVWPGRKGCPAAERTGGRVRPPREHEAAARRTSGQQNEPQNLL